MNNIGKLLMFGIAALSTSLQSDPPKIDPAVAQLSAELAPDVPKPVPSLPLEIWTYIAQKADASSQEAMSHAGHQFRKAAIESVKQEPDSIENFIWLIMHNDPEAMRHFEDIQFELNKLNCLCEGEVVVAFDDKDRWEREFILLKTLMQKINNGLISHDRVHPAYIDIVLRASSRHQLFLQGAFAQEQFSELSERALDVISRYADINLDALHVIRDATQRNMAAEPALRYVKRQHAMPFEHRNYDLYSSVSIDILKDLTGNEYQPALDYAVEFLAKYINYVESSVFCQQTTRFLARDLVKKGYGHSEALHLAITGMNLESAHCVRVSLMIFSALLENLLKSCGDDAYLMAENPIIEAASRALEVCDNFWAEGELVMLEASKVRALLGIITQASHAQLAG